MNYQQRNTLHSLIIVAFVLTLLGIMFLGISALSDFRNDQKQAACHQQGGEFYRASWSGRSLCKINK